MGLVWFLRVGTRIFELTEKEEKQIKKFDKKIILFSTRKSEWTISTWLVAFTNLVVVVVVVVVETSVAVSSTTVVPVVAILFLYIVFVVAVKSHVVISSAPTWPV